MTPNFQKGRNISSVIETNDIPEDFNISFEANDLYFDSEIGDKFKDTLIVVTDHWLDFYWYLVNFLW